MKTEIKTDFGTIEHVTQLITKTPIKIGSFYDNGIGVFKAIMEVPTAPNCSGTKIITVAQYSGSLNCNSGISRNERLPFQITKGAEKAWESFVKEVEIELIKYICEF